MRIEPKAWGPAADSPTFLPPDALTVEKTQPRPSRSAPKSDSIITSAPKAKAAKQPTVSRNPSQSTVKPLPAPPVVEAPAPVAAAPVAPPFVQFEGGASFDPHALPLPPELAPPVYDWLRRLALQADLAGADRLLREAFAELSSALSVLIIYSGPDGLHSLGANDELPKDTQPIVAVARSRRALVATHVAYLPIATVSETIAVVQLQRNPRQPAFNMVDQVTMAALARESAAILHHLVVQHLQRRTEAEADKKSLYRPEALESHRKRGQEGVVTELSPGWVRRTYHVLVVSILVGIGFATYVQVPTYSSGTGVVVFNGTPVTTPAPGTVDKVFVMSGQAVHKGDLLVRLKADKEEADLRQASTELESALDQYLFDPADETIRKSLITAQSQAKRAEDALAQRSVRAPIDGTVSDVRIRSGVSLEFGAPILTIVEPGTEPEIWAFLPGSDRPRLHAGQTLQIDLLGFEKTREQAKIYSVGRDATGAAELRRSLGAELADSLKLPTDGGSFVLVKAKLPKASFRAKGQTYHFHQGMPAKTEVRVESKRFIVTLLPSLEKYLP